MTISDLGNSSSIFSPIFKPVKTPSDISLVAIQESGNKVLGQTTVTLAPNRKNVEIFERATLECLISPTIYICFPVISPTSF